MSSKCQTLSSHFTFIRIPRCSDLSPISQVKQLRFRVGKTLPGVTQLTGGRARIKTQDCLAPTQVLLQQDTSPMWGAAVEVEHWVWGEKGRGGSGSRQRPYSSAFILVSLHGCWQTRKFLQELKFFWSQVK